MADTPAALIFDCDGVLVDSEYLASRVETEVVRRLGLTLTVDEAHDLFLGRTVDGVVDEIAARAGRRPDAAFVYDWAFATARTFLAELKPIPFIPGAVRELRRRGHALAVASQSPPARVRLSLEAAGYGDTFGDHVYVTSMVERPKPAPDVYLLAARRLGAEPAGCVVIEDSVPGAASARAAGFRTIGYAPAGTYDAMRATGVEVIRSMDELVARIELPRD